ncbi:MAG: metalloregulator ArsR/SmtB family transcription factor [Rhodothermales bacterium]
MKSSARQGMGKAKSDMFSRADNEVAMLAHALGHPARIAIMRHLARTQGCICGDLVGILPLSQSTVSQHLLALKKAGLIDGQVEGTSVCYCVNRTAWRSASERLRRLFEFVDERCC